MDSQGYVKTTSTNSVKTIEFYHPAQNSLPGYLLSELASQIEQAGKDENTILIILKSAGDRSFCAGASFNELVSLQEINVSKKFFMGFANVINAIRKCPKIVIGRIHGKAVGGGVGLAAACDYCMATKHASIRLSELAVGIGPFVIGPVVERKTGLSAFSQLALSPNQWQSAEWSGQKGLYTEVFETVEQLDRQIEIFCNDLTDKSPEALSQLKKIFWEGTENWDTLLEKRAEISGNLILSDFAKKAIMSFLNT